MLPPQSKPETSFQPCRSPAILSQTLQASNLHYHPPREGPALYTDASPASNLSLELPAPGLAYTSLALSIPPPGAAWNASTEEAGVSSAGVALSAVEALSNSAAALADDPYTNVRALVKGWGPRQLGTRAVRFVA